MMTATANAKVSEATSGDVPSEMKGTLSPFSTREQLLRHFSMKIYSRSTGDEAFIQYPYGSNFLTGINPLWVFQVIKDNGPRCGPFMMYFDATNKCTDK